MNDLFRQDVPSWTRKLLCRTGLSSESWNGNGWQANDRGWLVRSTADDSFTLLSVRVADAVDLAVDDFQTLSEDIYLHFAECLAQHTAQHPVRLWNYIPGILEPLGDLPHRYMVFNAGRFQGLQRWLGDCSAIRDRVATASGVGTDGKDLIVHCLAARDHGTPVENPRQVASYCYSSRYGPTPPCFARATRVQPEHSELPWLLVGGTASVRGEDSVYSADLASQLEETLRNLAALIHVGTLNGHRRPDEPLADSIFVPQLLHRYDHLRVYYVRTEDLAQISALVESRTSDDTVIEYVHADLCRPELLVEIEGVARLQSSSHLAPQPHLGALGQR